MGTSLLLFWVTFTVVGGVAVAKDGSGWFVDQKESGDSSEEKLIDDINPGLLNDSISANDKNSFDYAGKQPSFITSYSFIYSSIREASISEYDGYANDRGPGNHDVTTSVSETLSKGPDLSTVQGGEADHTSDHGSKPTGGKDVLTDTGKSSEGNRGIKEIKGQEHNATEGNKPKLNTLEWGLMIFFGILLIGILVGILSGTVIRMERKLRSFDLEV